MTEWTSGEKQFIAATAAAAPSVHDTRPWLLEFHDERRVSLYERLDRALPRHDPLGRDRLISCGAALEHVRLAVRVLGWVPEIELPHERAHPDEVARIAVVGRGAPSDVEERNYLAVSARHSHRRPFASRPVDAELRRELLGAHRVDGVGLRPVTDAAEIAALARLLSHSALVLRADRAYQRELTAWTAPVPEPPRGEEAASTTRPTSAPPLRKLRTAAESLRHLRSATRSSRSNTLPWAGLVRSDTAIPDLGVLADRLGREFLVLVETPDDGRHDHVRAGMAAEQTWLTAVASGLVGSVVTQPFQLREVRAGLVESLSPGGFPQLLLRFGHL